MTVLRSSVSVLAITDHTDNGACRFHFSAILSEGAPCPICLSATIAPNRTTQTPTIAGGDSGGPLAIKAGRTEACVFFCHGGITAPTRIEEGDQANDHRLI